MIDQNFTPKSLTVGNDTFSYYQFGSGIPLFAISGFHTDFTRLKPLLLILSKHFTVYFPILPGIHNQEKLNHGNHNSQIYAGYIKDWISALDIKNYILAGFCYGALIAVRLLQKNIHPKAVLLFEPLYDGNFFHFEKTMRLFIKLVLKLGPENKFNRQLVNFVLHNKKFLTLYFKLKYRDEPQLDELLSHQIGLTSMMNTKSAIEMVTEMMNLKLTAENLHFDFPAIMIFNKTDNIMDIPKTSKGMKSIFPNSQIFEVTMKHHAPLTPMDHKFVNELISPILPSILKL